jgi:hypothetical protein
VGSPLVTQLGRYLRLTSVGPSLLKQVDRDRKLVLATRKDVHVDTQNRAQGALLDYSDRGFYGAFPQL